jgi:hypothetical protein
VVVSLGLSTLEFVLNVWLIIDDQHGYSTESLELITVLLRHILTSYQAAGLGP